MILQGLPRLVVGWLVEIAMAGMNLFMLLWACASSIPPGSRRSPTSR